MDRTTKPRNPSLNWKAAVDELIIGRDLASQLGSVLEEASPTSTSRDLLRKVSDSFSRALVALDMTGVKSEADVTRSPQNSGGEKGESTVRGKKREMESGQRGGRRRIKVDDSCKSITTTTLNDGHSWRKYGQKVILNSKSPRGYYRCTHKNDRKCLATRRVQQSEENPSLFVITYAGEHTCREPADAFSPLETDPCIIDFSRSTATTTTVSNQRRGFSANYILSTKQESDIEEVVGSGDVVVLKSPGSSSPGCLAVPELDTLDESESARLVEELMGIGGASEHCDVTSTCLQPSSSIGDLGWDLMDDDDSFDISCIFDYNQGGTLYWSWHVDDE